MTGVFYQEMVSPQDADCILVGIPWDGTVSGRPGTRFGPQAIRSATLNVEDYSPYLDRDISDIRIYDAGDIELPHGDTGAALDLIRETYAQLRRLDTKMIVLGGEHLITLPVIEVLHETYGDHLFVVQFDAHADLREEYLGVQLSHATVMRNISRSIGIENTAVIGVRSGTRDEWRMLREHPYFFSEVTSLNVDDFRTLVQKKLVGNKIYITVDLDVFDPGVMPGTGTPEPGGIGFRTFVDLLKSLDGLDIIGADIVELAPDYDHSGISSALAATVLRELLLIVTN